MARIVIKYGTEIEAILEDEQSAAKLMLALKGTVRTATPPRVTSTPALPSKHKPPTPPSPLQDAVRRVLISEPQTTRQLIEGMEKHGYRFTAKDKTIAVNSALTLMEGKGQAKVHGMVAGTNQKLWVKGRD